MIHTREHLIHVLTEAAEIEHNLLCSYLYAAFSMKRAGEPGLSEAQGHAVERWRKAILKVSLEEMAHLASVNNLLIAVGGAPHFDRPNLPVAPGYHPAGLVVRLAPFTAITLEHFIFLERAAHLPLQDASGYQPTAAERFVRPAALTPSAPDYDTVGDLYDAIAAGFRHLAAAMGEAALIDASGACQIDSGMVALPDIIRIVDLDSALTAVEWIKEQGEGSSGVRQESHFDRFCAIRDEWAVFSAADPAFEPAWPAAHDPVMRKPAADAERTWVTAEPAADYLDLGNALYGVMLQVLNQAFSCSDPEAQVRLMKASVEVMEASAAVANALVRLPADPDLPGVNAGLSFAVPRNLGFRPAAAAHDQVFRERLLQLQAGAGAVLQGEAAEKAGRRIGAALDLLAPGTS